MPLLIRPLTLLLSAAFVALPAQAAPSRPGLAALISHTPLALQIDGRLDEASWAKAAENTRFYQFEPEDGIAAPDAYKTSVRILVDGDALVFGIRAWHAAGETPRGTLARRDKVERDQDYIGIWVDPSGHGRSAQFVRVNVAGVLSDGIYRSDEDEDDEGPDFPVESGVQLLPDGYTMEIRWPLSSLRFPYGEARPWGLMIERSVPQADGMLLLSGPLKKGALHFIAEMDEIAGMAEVLPVVQDRRYWELRPELTVRRTNDYGKRGSETSLGLDINARPRADWVFNATLNPDFSQVEIDEPTSSGTAQIARDLPERRAFFLESADVLGMRLPSFYSRTVADPRWGARVTWRGAAADATALSLADRAGGVVLRGAAYETREFVAASASTATLLRARRHGDEVVAGVFLSDRDYGRHGRNSVFGVDGQWRKPSTDDRHLQLAWTVMGSRTSALSDTEPAPLRGPARSGAYAWGKLDYRSDAWFNMAQLEVIGTEFVNDNGFVPQAGLVKGEIQLNRRMGPQRFDVGGGLEAYETELHLGLHENRTLAAPRDGVPGGEVVQRWVRPGIWFYTARQTRFWADLGFDRQRGRTGLALHKVPAVHMGLESSPLPWLTRLRGEWSLGRQLDVDADRVGRGGVLELEAALRFPLPGGWSLESDHRWNRVWVRHRDRQDYIDYGWRWVGTLHASPRDALRMIVQNTSTERLPGPVLEPWSEHYRHRSLLYKHTARHGRVVSLGATTDANGALPGASKGLTLKVQWEL